MGLCTDPVVIAPPMKTSSYNPSPLEVDFANALQILSGEIEKHLLDNKVTHVENQLSKDNPLIKFNLVDKDGDPHEIVVRIIQIPDKF
jgi:hypothetical protein